MTESSLATSVTTKKIIVGSVIAASAIGLAYFLIASRSTKTSKKSSKSKKAKKQEKKTEEVESNDEKPKGETAKPVPEASSSNVDESAQSTPKEKEPEIESKTAKNEEIDVKSVTAKVAETKESSPADSKKKSKKEKKMSPAKKLEEATQLKNKGNDLYKKGEYEGAIEYYTQAIDLSPETSVFWSNRAACWALLHNYEKVIEDCNEALKIDPAYVKALHRRALAYEQLGKLKDALKDYTTICVIEGFKNQMAIQASERLLKQVAESEAKEMSQSKTPSLPSPTFVCAYLDAFRKSLSTTAEPTTNTASPLFHLQSAIKSLKEHKFDSALDHCNTAIELVSFSDSESMAEQDLATLYNMHGTFLFLKGQIDEALEAFDKSLEIDSKNVNTLVKKSNVFMEKGDTQATMEVFEKAIEVDSNDPDIYYHRGQVKFLMGDFPGAVIDYQRSIDLDKNFVFAYIQLGVAQYKLGSIQTALSTLKQATKKFPKSFDLYNYYGELLLDQQRFNEALDNFEKSISLSPNSPLPYINKALLMFQFKGDMAGAESLMKKAVEVDSKCDVAYVQLANFLLQQGKVDESTNYFDKAIDLARTEAELVNAITAKESAMAQYHVTTVLPAHIIAQSLSGA